MEKKWTDDDIRVAWSAGFVFATSDNIPALEDWILRFKELKTQQTNQAEQSDKRLYFEAGYNYAMGANAPDFNEFDKDLKEFKNQ